jgi:glycine cleavage system aminomethyltransferase T
MSSGAKVYDLEALTRIREALCVFGADVREALTAADADIQRMIDWLHEELKWWQKEVHRRQDLLGQARNALNHKKLERVFGRKPDITEEEKAYRRAKARLEQAEDKVERIRKAIPEFQRAVMLYQGPARQLAAYLDTQMPRSLHWLDARSSALEEYVRLAPPSPSLPVVPGGGEESQAPSARGGGDGNELSASLDTGREGERPGQTDSAQGPPAIGEVTHEFEHEPGTDP